MAILLLYMDSKILVAVVQPYRGTDCLLWSADIRLTDSQSPVEVRVIWTQCCISCKPKMSSI